MLWGPLSLWATEAAAALAVYAVVVAIVVITDDREPTSTLAWILVLIAFPLLGLPFYYLFGRNWKKRMRNDPWLARVNALAAPVMARVRARYSAPPSAPAESAERGYADIVRLIERTEGVTPLPAYGVELLFDGGATFAALKRDLAAATDTIDIQSYIWERDRLTAELTTILLDRLAAGVEVRLLDDWVGSLFYRKDELRRLRAAGARVFSDVTDLRKVNYRDHRKIVVIDGKTGYTGGFNVGQEYIDGGKRYPAWRDTHVRFHGPAVADLQKLFAIRWNGRTGEDLFSERFFPADYPETGRRTPAQIVSTGVDQAWDPAPRAHMIGFSTACRRIWIQSPYLVPTADIGSALTTAALSGLDVRFMMTGWPDKRIAYYAAESYFRQLVDAGVKVYRYKRGFLHAKTMTIDGRVAVVGTMNLDIRSLALDQELMMWVYDAVLAEQHEAQFLADVEQCELVTRAVIDGWSSARRLRNAAARLASNLL
jgi:cardiolipin synthase